MSGDLENRDAYFGGMFDVDVQSLRPERVKDEENMYWLNFFREPENVYNITKAHYFIGNQMPYYDSVSKVRGKIQIVDTDWENNRVKAKFLD